MEVEFVLRIKPRVPKSCATFDGSYEGMCRVTKCASRTDLVGTVLTLYADNIVSCSTCFVYRGKTLRYAVSARGLKYLSAPKSELIMAVRPKERLDREDFRHMLDETDMLGYDAAWAAELTFPMSHADFVAFVRTKAELCERAEVLRVECMQALLSALAPKKKSAQVVYRRMSLTEMIAVKEVFVASPWMFVFPRYLRSKFPSLRLKATTVGKLTAIFKFDELPVHIRLALRIYDRVRKQESWRNDTLFRWADAIAPFGAIRTCERAVRDFLEEHAIIFFDVAKTIFSFCEPYVASKIIFQAVLRCIERAKTAVPRVRDTYTPVIPPKLTVAQTNVARAIMATAISVVEGFPGTGKTALITWAMSHFSNALLCSLTGMMVQSLQTRMGRRREAAHTIHSIICANEFNENGSAWLEQFDVLIVDEVSNVSGSLMSKLLWCLPNLCRIILVGDSEQIRSIKPGDPILDFVGFAKSHRLTEILRVDKKLQSLYEAPFLIANGHADRLVFARGTPLQHITKVRDVNGSVNAEKTLAPLLKYLHGITNSPLEYQLIVLQHTEADVVNSACHAIHRDELHTLRPHPSYDLGGRRVIHIGTKIMFFKNYKVGAEITRTTRTGTHTRYADSVMNGEVGIVESINPVTAGTVMITFVSEISKNGAGKTTKTIVCSRSVKNAVDPVHIGLGYATTSSKVQGREFRVGVFWNNCSPKHHWTRAHPYVALSRGMEVSIYVGELRDLYEMCTRPAPVRRSILSAMFKKHAVDLDMAKTVPSGHEVVEPSRLKLLDASRACVPVLKDVVKKGANSEEDGKDL